MANRCAECGEIHSPASNLITYPAACLEAAVTRMKRLLINIAGESKRCDGCNTPIFWVTHKNGKRVPYTLSGLNHFADCPAAEQFKQKVARADS